MSNRTFQSRTLSSLAKVFPRRIYGKAARNFKVATGQELSFQIAYRLRGSESFRGEYTVHVTSSLSVDSYRVGNVPSIVTTDLMHRDDNYLTVAPGIFPDPLFPLNDNEKITALEGIWNALWFSVRVPADLDSGEYYIIVELINSNGACEVRERVTLDVSSVSLHTQKLLYTNWFHCDCIASAHRVGIFSEEHWRLIGEYMKMAADHGMNMILTPVLTPPLDTEVGTYRPTIQLVDIKKSPNGYEFDFSRLERFVSMARSYGIHTFEINHFFTQWGAKCAPKVVACVDGEEKCIFGWDTASNDAEYVYFLGQLIPLLIKYMENIGVGKENMYFHVSDEPAERHVQYYKVAHDILLPLIAGCRHMDALSERSYYEQRLVEVPVVANDHIEPWLGKTDNLWCYYCCGQTVDVSNRFLSQPSARNRIIGVQLYKYGIEGFLHWGYNFYYTYLSRREVDPYSETDGGQKWPSGDTFCVYPYGDTVIPSLRLKVFSNALEDMRLLELLEEKIGREAVIAQIDRIAGMEITFSEYPRDDAFFDVLYDFIFSIL